MYYNWFTHDFMTEASRYELATFAGTFACKVTKINEFQSVVQFKYAFLGCKRTFITSNCNIFHTKKEALEAARDKIKNDIETANKAIAIIDEEIANENNIS